MLSNPDDFDNQKFKFLWILWYPDDVKKPIIIFKVPVIVGFLFYPVDVEYKSLFISCQSKNMLTFQSDKYHYYHVKLVMLFQLLLG